MKTWIDFLLRQERTSTLTSFVLVPFALLGVILALSQSSDQAQFYRQFILPFIVIVFNGFSTKIISHLGRNTTLQLIPSLIEITRQSLIVLQLAQLVYLLVINVIFGIHEWGASIVVWGACSLLLALFFYRPSRWMFEINGAFILLLVFNFMGLLPIPFIPIGYSFVGALLAILACFMVVKATFTSDKIPQAIEKNSDAVLLFSDAIRQPKILSPYKYYQVFGFVGLSFTSVSFFSVIAIGWLGMAGFMFLASDLVPTSALIVAVFTYCFLISAIALLRIPSTTGIPNLTYWAMLPIAGTRDQFARKMIFDGFKTSLILFLPAWLTLAISIFKSGDINTVSIAALIMSPLLVLFNWVLSWYCVCRQLPDLASALLLLILPILILAALLAISAIGFIVAVLLIISLAFTLFIFSRVAQDKFISLDWA